MQNQYTPEQVGDIKAREAKGLEALKELQLTPAAAISKVNIGNDVFADKLTPFLQDTRYTIQPSPIQQKDLDASAPETA